MDKKVVVITGGTGGIGTAMAKTMAEDGYNVVITYLEESEKEQAEKAIEEMKEKTGCEGLVVQTDVTDYDACENLMNKTIEKFGTVDVLVNNAGVFPSGVAFHEMEVKQMQQTLQVNLLGVMLGTRAALPHMLKAGKGCIVNTASIAGLQSSPSFADYSASKAGVIGFTRTIAGEYANKKIRCNAIAPGIIDTSMIDHMEGSDQLEGIPLDRLGTPEDIADCLDYIVRADYLTGQTISPNGGMVMN